MPTIPEYVMKAKAALKEGRNDDARVALFQACEMALTNAQRSFGAEKDKNLAMYSQLKEMLAMVPKNAPKKEPKSDIPTIPTIPVPPTPPTPPKADLRKEPEEPKEEPKAGSGSGGSVKRPEYNDTITPRYLTDYIGQPQAVMAVKDLIVAARLKGTAMPHIILYGSHGLGKSTFGKIIANEMNADFIEVNATKMNPQEMVAILKKIKPKSIVFIDEIHTVPLVVAESVLYSAMQDRRITYTEGKGKFARTEVFNLPPFTLIGATTEIGKIAKPFTQRAIQVRLEEYSDEVLGGIIARSFGKLGTQCSLEDAIYIAKRCRNNPRIANNTTKRISDKALVRYAIQHNITDEGLMESPERIRKFGISITKDVIDEFFEENGIDKYGLEKGDRDLLRIIIERYNGGPVGVDTLARVMNEQNNVITQKYEAYLIKKGFLKIEREGRVVMPAAYEALGLPIPKDKLVTPEPEEQTPPTPPVITPAAYDPVDTSSPKEEDLHSKYETRKVLASSSPDPLKCEKVEELITYPETVEAVEGDLDEMFPDVEKQYEGETKHACFLEISFEDHKRTLLCDSFLESRFATVMASVGFLSDIKAQTLELPYISQELSNRRYYPDFVVKDYKGRIAVIEMKNFDMLSYHLNIDKYEKLREYCEKMGYGYAEIAKAYNADTYISFDQIKNRDVDEELRAFIIDRIEYNGNETGEGAFLQKDFEQYVQDHPNVKKEDVFTILMNDRRLKNTDRIGNEFHIIMN